MARGGKLRDQTLRRIEQAWTQLPAYNQGNVEDFLSVMMPILAAGQIATATLAAGYLAVQASALRGVPAVPAPVDTEKVTAPRDGVSPEETYRRPFVTVWTELKNGTPYSTAVKHGLDRLKHTAGIDLQLAKTIQADTSLTHSGASFYRRTLTGAESCRMCIVAATQRYRVGSLAPIHSGCDCGVEELPAGEKPGQIIDPGLYEAVMGVAPSGSRTEMMSDIIRVEQHGETGPTLTLVGQRWTGPAALDPNI